MGEINTDFLSKCIAALEKSYKLLKKSKLDTVDYEMYRNSLVKSFEIILEQSGKLLKKKITPYFPSQKAVDALNFKDLFRHAAKHGLLSGDETAMWFKYRDNRSNTAHDYGEQFAEETLSLIDGFVKSAKKLEKIIKNG